MKSRLLIIITLLLAVNEAFSANPVSREEAAIVARNFYFERINQIEETALADISIRNVVNIRQDDKQLFYAVNLESGFVLVSAHKNVYPVLAYAFEGRFDIPQKQQNVAAWLGQYER